MVAKNDESKASSDREITASRIFDAPRDLVFKLWTEPHHIDRWWGPNGFRTTTHQMEMRTGGTWRHTMHSPDGTEFPNEIVYDEVVAPERIIYTHVSHPRFQSHVTFEDIAGKTKLSVRMVFESSELRDKVAKECGAVEGLGQTLGRLDEHIGVLNASVKDLVLRREFDAPPAVLFKLWTDPKHLANWWGPQGFTNPRCELDVRPGGKIHIDMRGPNGVTYPMFGTYREVIEPTKLVFASGALDESGKPVFEILNTVTFEERQGKTLFTLHTSIISYTAIAPVYFSGQEMGWTMSLDKLTNYVASVTLSSNR